MKNRTYFNWLIIFVGVVAIIGIGFTPALADDEFSKNIGDPDEAAVLDESEDELNDDSFGQKYQYTWIPCYSFTPISSLTGYSTTGAHRYFTIGANAVMDASINLPSGAYLNLVRLYYYDNTAGALVMRVYREYPNNNSSQLGGTLTSSNGGYGNGAVYPNHTIANGGNLYSVRISGSATGTSLSFMGVRLYWKRQIRYGLSHPFGDIGFLPYEFRSSIAALYQSGITTGTTSTTYSPLNNVTRAEMAVFLARALGLYWGYPY